MTDNKCYLIKCAVCGHEIEIRPCNVDGKKALKYRKKPVVVEAIQWNGDNLTEIINFVDRNVLLCSPLRFATHEEIELSIETLEGNHLVTKGDYIIKGVKGEFYPCKPDIFEQTYEMVGEE